MSSYTDSDDDSSDVQGFSQNEKNNNEDINTNETSTFDPYDEDPLKDVDNDQQENINNSQLENTTQETDDGIISEEQLEAYEQEQELRAQRFNSENEGEEEESKIEPPEKNIATKVEKKNLFLVVGGGILAIFLLAIFLPQLFPEKKVKKQTSEENVDSRIPGFLEYWEEKEKKPDKRPDEIDKSTLLPETDNIDDLEKKLLLAAELEKSKNEPPPRYNSAGTVNTASTRPETHRNEQQKASLRMELIDKKQKEQMEQQMAMSQGGKFPITNYGNSGYGAYGQNYADTVAQRNQMLQQTLSSLASGQNSQDDGISPSQRNKQNFFTNEFANSQFQLNSEYSLWSETIIPAVLITAINTDLPGVVVARVTQNIYSSQNGKYLLIPQGTQLMATYNSSISYGQNRVQIVWNKMIRPDGLEMDLGSLNGVDEKGMSGQGGFVNTHPFQYAKALGLIAVFSILNTKIELLPTNNLYTQNAMADVYKTANQVNSEIIDRALDIQPTITIPSGTMVNLITNATLEIPPYQNFEVHQKYVRTR